MPPTSSTSTTATTKATKKKINKKIKKRWISYMLICHEYIIKVSLYLFDKKKGRWLTMS